MKHIVPALRRNLARGSGREPPPVGQKRPTHDGHDPALTISVASYNVHKCVGTDGMFDPGRVLSVVLELQADIVALQEADQRFGSRRGLLDLKALYEKGGYRSVLDVGSRKLSHGWHGNVILYREGAGNVANVHKMTLPGFEPRGAVLGDFDLGGLPLPVALPAVAPRPGAHQPARDGLRNAGGGNRAFAHCLRPPAGEGGDRCHPRAGSRAGRVNAP